MANTQSRVTIGEETKRLVYRWNCCKPPQIFQINWQGKTHARVSLEHWETEYNSILGFKVFNQVPESYFVLVNPRDPSTKKKKGKEYQNAIHKHSLSLKKDSGQAFFLFRLPQNQKEPIYRLKMMFDGDNEPHYYYFTSWGRNTILKPLSICINRIKESMNFICLDPEAIEMLDLFSKALERQRNSSNHDSGENRREVNQQVVVNVISDSTQTTYDSIYGNMPSSNDGETIAVSNADGFDQKFGIDVIADSNMHWSRFLSLDAQDSPLKLGEEVQFISNNINSSESDAIGSHRSEQTIFNTFYTMVPLTYQNDAQMLVDSNENVPKALINDS